MLHSWLSLVQTFRATTIIWKQQWRSEKLGPATQTQYVLLNYNRNPWLLSKLLGTWRSNRPSSRPDLWSSVCFVFSWSQVFLLHTDPCSARQITITEGGRLEAAQMFLRCYEYSAKQASLQSYYPSGPSGNSDFPMQYHNARDDIFSECFILSVWKITFLLWTQYFPQQQYHNDGNTNIIRYNLGTKNQHVNPAVRPPDQLPYLLLTITTFSSKFSYCECLLWGFLLKQATQRHSVQLLWRLVMNHYGGLWWI